MENNKRVINIIVLDKFEIWKNLAKSIDKRSGYGNSDHNNPNNSVAIISLLIQLFSPNLKHTTITLGKDMDVNNLKREETWDLVLEQPRQGKTRVRARERALIKAFACIRKKKKKLSGEAYSCETVLA